MRVKSEARRDAILAVALDAFRELGFEAASMSLISARVGGSKATLYNYFASKEELLLEAMLFSGRKHADDILALLQSDGDLATQLRSFVRSLLSLINSPQTTEILRVAISVGGSTDIGKRFYELGSHRVWKVIAKTLALQSRQGVLRVDADPAMMSMHLRCLCEVDLIPNLLGVPSAQNSADIDHKADRIVDIFLRAYGHQP
jgi:AcrR family transcriptional regulator